MNPVPFTAMEIRTAHFCGTPIAVCPVCKQVCAHWDADDLDEFMQLRCYHPDFGKEMA